MQVRAIIDKDGTVTTEVVNTEEVTQGVHLCTSVYTITNKLGKQTSDEETGPDCPSTANATNIE